jgi:hypothetical protein
MIRRRTDMIFYAPVEKFNGDCSDLERISPIPPISHPSLPHHVIYADVFIVPEQNDWIAANFELIIPTPQ